MSINKFQEIEQDIGDGEVFWGQHETHSDEERLHFIPMFLGPGWGEGASDTRLNKQGDKTYTLEEERKRMKERQLKMETRERGGERERFLFVFSKKYI